MYTLQTFIAKICHSLTGKAWDALDNDPWAWIYDEDLSVDIEHETYSINDIAAFGELYLSATFQEKIQSIPDLLDVCNDFYEEYRIWTRAKTGERDCSDEIIDSFFIVNTNGSGGFSLDVSLINFEDRQPRGEKNRQALLDYLDTNPYSQKCIEISLAETNETCSIDFLAAVEQRKTFNQLIHAIENSIQDSTIMISCVPNPVQITRLCQALSNNAYKISGLLFVDEFNALRENQKAQEHILSSFNYAKEIASSSPTEALPKDNGSKEHFSDHILRIISKQINRLEANSKPQSAAKRDAFKKLKQQMSQIQRSGDAPESYATVFVNWEQRFLRQMAITQNTLARAKLPKSVEKVAKISKILRQQIPGETAISDATHQKYYEIMVKLSNRLDCLMKKEISTDIQTKLEELHNITASAQASETPSDTYRKSTRSIKVTPQQLRINLAQLTFFTRRQIKIHELTQLCDQLLTLPLQERTAENLLKVIDTWNNRPKLLQHIARRPSMWKSDTSSNEAIIAQIVADLTALCPQKGSVATAIEHQTTKKL